MDFISVEQAGPVWSYSIKEDDGPAFEAFCFDAVVHIGDESYPLEYDGYDPEDGLSGFVADIRPDFDYDQRRDAVWKILADARKIIDPHREQ